MVGENKYKPGPTITRTIFSPVTEIFSLGPNGPRGLKPRVLKNSLFPF
jgi:hypothetical protein